jgi:hypothetical protein
MSKSKSKSEDTQMKNLRIVPVGDPVQKPSIVFEGKAPKKGTDLKFKLSNGITYSGKVENVTENKNTGEVQVSFKDGMIPA